MKLLGIALVCIALAAASGAAAAAEGVPAAARAAPHAGATLSFAELYRLTVGSAAPLETHEARAALRPVSAEPPRLPSAPVFAVGAGAAPAEETFSIGSARLGLPQPSSRWLLFASALALAGWVARRRLSHPL